jgi:hypothetical protein
MLRQSTQHLSGDLDYIVQRPMLVQWDVTVDDDIRQLGVGDVVPGEIAEAWPNRAVNNLMWVGKLVAVPRGTVLGDETVGAAPAEVPAAPEWPRDMGGGLFQLSDGSIADGNLAALDAQAALDADGPADPVLEQQAFELVPLGGGFFQLSDGSKVRGRNKAAAAQAELDAQAAAAVAVSGGLETAPPEPEAV